MVILIFSLSTSSTHIIHSHTAQLTSEWERTIASLLLQEGLATQVSKYITPGEQDEIYIEHENGRFQSCKDNKAEILKGVIPFLKESSSSIVTRFTFGNGTTNYEREAYFIGWELVQALIEKEITFEEMASIKEENIPEYINKTIDDLFV